MTREESIRHIEAAKLMLLGKDNQPISDLYYALEVAIEALKAEPCDVFDEYGNYKYPSDVELTESNTATSIPCPDAISRQAVLKTLDDMDNVLDEDRTIENYKELLKECYEVLPPVNPQSKTGHWIFDEILDKHYYCSECKSMGVDYWDFCPNCGAKMVDPKESER